MGVVIYKDKICAQFAGEQTNVPLQNDIPINLVCDGSTLDMDNCLRTQHIGTMLASDIFIVLTVHWCSLHENMVRVRLQVKTWIRQLKIHRPTC